MKAFRCDCGQPVFFDNSWCVRCGSALGFDPDTGEILTLSELPAGRWWSRRAGCEFRVCQNGLDFGICNWLIPAESPHERCDSCRLNRIVPDLSMPDNVRRWRRIEQAKRRLLCDLRRLGLPLQARLGATVHGLRFDFLEDRRSRPEIDLAFVTTGHIAGVITINVLEADEVQLAQQRELVGESYRTLLGHFRHESGHFYFDHLVVDRGAFCALFGDPDRPYAEALRDYYADGPRPGWAGAFISAYASAHPHEDWAESFAHYLHITDTLETARSFGLLEDQRRQHSFRDELERWEAFSVTLNELNRSLGLPDAYPFVITPAIAAKLLFVDLAIQAHAGRR